MGKADGGSVEAISKASQEIVYAVLPLRLGHLRQLVSSVHPAHRPRGKSFAIWMMQGEIHTLDFNAREPGALEQRTDLFCIRQAADRPNRITRLGPDILVEGGCLRTKKWIAGQFPLNTEGDPSSRFHNPVQFSQGAGVRAQEPDHISIVDSAHGHGGLVDGQGTQIAPAVELHGLIIEGSARRHCFATGSIRSTEM